jgi:PAS domain S-box-containing protein
MIIARSKQFSKRIILIALVVIGLAIYLGLQNYLLFHSLVELISIIIAFNIFIIAFNAVDIVDNNFFIFLGLAYFFVGAFDLLHTLAYKGLGIFANPGANLATQLWIIARYIESCSLLIAFRFIDKDIKFDKIMAIYALLSVILLVMLFQYQIFPDCFVADSALTLFKIVSEYLIVAILIVVSFLLMQKREDLSPKLYHFLKYSILASIGAELSFTLYSDVYGISNMMGHIFKSVSFYLIYIAVVETSFRQPYTNLFQELVSKNEKLEAERDKLDKYFEVSGVMIIGIDQNSKIVEVNQKSCQVLGYSKEELCGKEWSHFFAEEEVKRAKDIFANVPAGQSSLINYGQNEVITRSGAKKKMIWTSRVLKDEAGNIKRISSSGLDVTKSCLLKEKLEYNRLQVEFFANLSHELKTPLNLIFSALKVADSYQEKNLAPDVYQDLNNYTEIIRQNSNRLLRLVNNLIDITKLNSNSFDLNLKNTDLVQLLEDIIDSVRSYIETEDRNLKFNSQLDQKVIACDPLI